MKKPQAEVLKGWTKKQIADALKTHSKKELLIMAMQWRIVAENYMKELKFNNYDTTTEDTPLESDS